MPISLNNIIVAELLTSSPASLHLMMTSFSFFCFWTWAIWMRSSAPSSAVVCAEWLYGADLQRVHTLPLLKTGSGGPPLNMVCYRVSDSHGRLMLHLNDLRHGNGRLSAQ